MSSADLVALEYIQESIIGTTPDDSAHAVGTLTGTGNVADTETVTLNGKVYTFQSTLTNVDGHVKVGATLALSLANLRHAINLDGGVAGTDYATATTEHPTIEATANSSTTVSLRAKASGTSGNALTTVEGSTNLSFGAATLTGGTNSTITAWKPVRYTGESVKFAIENTQSEEITPTRAESDTVQTSASATGDVNFELSFDTFKDWFAMALCNDWVSGGGDIEVLENGTDRKSMTIRKHFQDMTPEQFHVFAGTCIEGFTLNFELGQIVSGTWNLMGFGLDPDTGILEAPVAGETSVPATTTVPMNAVTNFKDFVMSGVPYAGCVNKLTLDVKNNLRAIRCLGSLAARNMKLGKFQVTGSMDLYFEDGSVFKNYVQGTEFDISFALQDAAGNRMDFAFDRVKFEDVDVAAGGQNTDVMLSGKIRALYDGVAGRVMQIISNPA